MSSSLKFFCYLNLLFFEDCLLGYSASLPFFSSSWLMTAFSIWSNFLFKLGFSLLTNYFWLGVTSTYLLLFDSTNDAASIMVDIVDIEIGGLFVKRSSLLSKACIILFSTPLEWLLVIVGSYSLLKNSYFLFSIRSYLLRSLYLHRLWIIIRVLGI